MRAALPAGVLLLQVRQLAIDRVPRGAVSRRSLQFEGALFEPYGFDLVVHRADVVELQSPDVLAVAFRPFHERLQRRPCLLRRPADLPLAFGNLAHGADERAGFASLDVDRAGRRLTLDNCRLVDPAEVRARDVAVAQFELNAMVAGVLLHRHRQRLAVDDFAQHDLAIAQRQLHEWPRPEEAETVDEDQRNHPRDHQQADAEALPANQIAGSPRRRNCGMPSSSRVPSDGLVTFAEPLSHDFRDGVDDEREREEQRGGKEEHAYSVPPCGASGISTAMLAESVRMPLKIDQSSSRRVASGHQNDHRLADSAAEADHDRRENARLPSAARCAWPLASGSPRVPAMPRSG